MKAHEAESLCIQSDVMVGNLNLSYLTRWSEFHSRPTDFSSILSENQEWSEADSKKFESLQPPKVECVNYPSDNSTGHQSEYGIKTPINLIDLIGRETSLMPAVFNWDWAKEELSLSPQIQVVTGDRPSALLPAASVKEEENLNCATGLLEITGSKYTEQLSQVTYGPVRGEAKEKRLLQNDEKIDGFSDIRGTTSLEFGYEYFQNELCDLTELGFELPLLARLTSQDLDSSGSYGYGQVI